MFSMWSDTMEDFTKWLKENYPDTLLISGSGVTPKFSAEYIDIYVKGFGEEAIKAILKWHTGNSKMPTFTLVDGGRKLVDAIAFYPAFPTPDLMVKYEDRDFIRSNEWLAIEFARGCKFKCDFCNFPVLGVKGDYSRDADNFREQIVDAYDRFGVKNYLVADETFNDRTEKITKFADVVEALPFDPWFSGFIRADLLVSRPRDREELLRMNFLGQFYGIETFDWESGKAVGKGMNPDRLKQGLIDIKDYYLNNGSKRYRGTLSFILGLPHETIDTLESTRQWLLDNWQGQNYVHYALEIPNNEYDQHSLISKDYKKYGYEDMVEATDLNKDHVKWAQVGLARSIFLWKTKHMNIIDALRIYDKWNETRYDPANKFRLDCWSLSFMDLPADLDSRLAVHEYEMMWQDDYNEQQMILVKDYKKKKLSL